MCFKSRKRSKGDPEEEKRSKEIDKQIEKEKSKKNGRRNYYC